MSGVQDANTDNFNQPGTSVGGSWLICRSKSYRGRVYYFNTLTGEAAWNLSDPEVEKAKNSTKLFESQGEIEGCPEPKEPPTDICNISSNRQSIKPQQYGPRVYNKQIINNQFSKQSYIPFGGHCTNCEAHVSQNLPHNCTPNVLTIPPNTQVFIAPIGPQITKPQQPSTNPTGFDSEDASLSPVKRFNVIDDTVPSRNKTLGGKPYFQNFNGNTHDLRQKLSAKKVLNNWSKPTEDADQDCVHKTAANRTSTQKINIIKPLGTSMPSDADEKWLKENSTLKGTQLVLNVSPLKKIANIHGNCMSWYVVADTNVLINNINLINVIVHSDETCQLLVPDYIMADLQSTSTQYNNLLMRRAHNALQSLTQQFTSGKAVVGEDPETDSRKLNIFEFCCQISSQGFGVVLVSNNIQLEKYRNSNHIPILTVSELKELLLTDNKPASPERPLLCSLRQIKITVPNNSIVKPDDSITDLDSSSKDTHMEHYMSRSKNIEQEKIVDGVTKLLNKYNGTVMHIPEKQTQDIGVQTDFGFCIQTNKSTSTESTQTDFNSPETETKRKAIQLKRNFSRPPAPCNVVEKKQSKWRARKPIVPCSNNTLGEKPGVNNSRILDDTLMSEPPNNCPNNAKNTEMEVVNFEGQISNINNDNTEGSGTYNEDLDTSETGSSSRLVKKYALENIVIEETSTSGISNSVSNVDSENMIIIKPHEKICKNIINEETDKNKCAMFEVESPAMEEYLKMRCDEWLSRFFQIMEEVLTVILQQDPPFVNQSLPPPWTLHEATACIKMKFSHDGDVVDAANKLAYLLFKISDAGGKINAPLKPTDFMEMYSYGVYLVDSLQMVLTHCDDLHTAADLLTKLLNDIKDSGQKHSDGFMDISNYSSTDTSKLNNVNPSITKSVAEKTPGKLSPNVKNPLTNTPSNEKKYNLRSNQKKRSEKRNEHSFVRKQLAFNEEKNETCNKQNETNLNANSDEMHNSEPANEPKIIRQFSKCLEFEEKLKNKQNYQDAMNYEEELEEGELEDSDDHNDEYDNEYEEEHYDEEMAEEGGNESEVKPEEHTNCDNNIACQQILGTVLREIQETLLGVRSFCDTTRKELINELAKMGERRKKEINEQAEEARSCLQLLIESLNSIVERDSNSTNKLQEILKDAGINPDDDMIDEYRDKIKRVPRLANILLGLVKNIIETVN